MGGTWEVDQYLDRDDHSLPGRDCSSSVAVWRWHGAVLGSVSCTEVGKMNEMMMMMMMMIMMLLMISITAVIAIIAVFVQGRKKRICSPNVISLLEKKSMALN